MDSKTAFFSHALFGALNTSVDDARWQSFFDFDFSSTSTIDKHGNYRLFQAHSHGVSLMFRRNKLYIIELFGEIAKTVSDYYGEFSGYEGTLPGNLRFGDKFDDVKLFFPHSASVRHSKPNIAVPKNMSDLEFNEFMIVTKALKSTIIDVSIAANDLCLTLLFDELQSSKLFHVALSTSLGSK